MVAHVNLDSLRRALGLHVHDWEELERTDVETPSNAAYSSDEMMRYGPSAVTTKVELLVERCRECGKVHQMRITIG